MKTASLALALVALGFAAPLLADGTVEVASAVSTRIYLDGEYVGDAPLTLSGLAAGDHQIQAEDPASGEVKTWMFHSPRAVHVSKRIEVAFDGVAPSAPTQVVYTTPASVPTATYARRVWSSTSCEPAPVVVSQPTVYAEPAVAVTAPRSNVERAKTHTRNTLLGLTLASQLTAGNSRDRKRYRNVGLGLTLLNEVLR